MKEAKGRIVELRRQLRRLRWTRPLETADPDPIVQKRNIRAAKEFIQEQRKRTNGQNTEVQLAL